MTGSHAQPRLLLVDFENVQQVDLKGLDDSYQVVIFVGTNQRNIPFDLVTNAQELGGRIEWQRIGGEGRNALDFFIAYYLGRVMERPNRPECIVLSKDRGFEPLLKYLNAAGMTCRRINSMAELHLAHAAAPTVRTQVQRPQVQRQPAQRPQVQRQPAQRQQAQRSEGRGSASGEKRVLRVVEVLSRLDKKARPRKRQTLAQSISSMFQRRLSKQDVDRVIEEMLVMKLVSESNGVITYEF